MELTQIAISPTEPDGPSLIHVLSVDPLRHGLRVEAALGGGTVSEPGDGREPVNRQVIRTGALAGINADYFSFDGNGDPLGLMIHGGDLVSEPAMRWGAFGFRGDGSAVMGRPSFTGSVTSSDGAVMALCGLNREVGDGELVLFSPAYGRNSPDRSATVAVLEASGTVVNPGVPLSVKVRDLREEKGAAPIPQRGFLLAGTGSSSDWLKAHATPGKTVRIVANIVEDGKDWSSVREAVAGGPILVRDGHEALDLDVVDLPAGFSSTRHPRTAVGVKKDGTIMLVAVDGRQAVSRGMSLPELAKTMVSLGAYEAMNLDGGGSTAMCVRGLVVNSPSDGGVRRVADALLVFDDAVKSRRIAAVPAGEGLKVVADGSRIEVAAPENAGGLLWGTLDGGACATQDGGLYGYRPGKATVVALRPNGAIAYEKAVTVLPGAAGKIAAVWADGVLKITIRDANNNPVQGQEIDLTKRDGTKTEVTTEPNGTALSPKGWLKDAHEPVTLSSGTLTLTWPVN